MLQAAPAENEYRAVSHVRSLDPMPWLASATNPARLAGARLSICLNKSGHVLKKLPGNIRIVLDELSEVPGRHRQAPHRLDGGHGREALSLGKERELAEVVPRSKPCSLLSADRDRRLSFDDDEEIDPAHLALAKDRRSRTVRSLLEVFPQAS